MKTLKYILLLPVLVLALGIGMQSCGDNTDFSKAHILTDDEMAELLRQKHVRDSLMTVINADSIVVTTVNLIASASSYDGVQLVLDHHAASETFGLTDEQVVQSIQNLWEDDAYQAGYPEFTAFAIENTTHDDNFGAQTQAGGFYGWGHWWNSKGDVTEWNYTNNDEAVYTSIYADLEKGVVYCDLGQYPGQLYDGEHITVMEGLRYTDENEVNYRIVYVFDVFVGELGDIEGDVVATLDIAGNIEYNGGYETSDIPVDIDEIVTLLGAPSWDAITWVAVNPDGSYWQEMDAGDGRGNGGFWFGQDGYKGAWGDEASVFMCFPTDEYVDAFSAAPMPGVFTEGSVATIHCAATYEGTGKIVEVNVTITVGAAAEIPNNVTYTSNYAVTQAFRDDYSTSLLPLNVDEICAALGIADLNEAMLVAYNEDGSLTKDGTANAGFYFNADGSIGEWGGSSVLFVEYYGGNVGEDEYQTLAIGIHPNILEREYAEGTIVPIKIGFAANGNVAMMEINWKLGDADEGFTAPTPVDGTVVFEATYNITQAYRDDYSTSLMPFDASGILSALGIASLEDAQIISVDSEGAYTKEQTAGNGFWYALDGTPMAWGTAVFFLEYHPVGDPTSVESSSLYVGMMPDVYDLGYTDGTVVPAIFGFRVGDNIALLHVNWQIGASDEGFTEGTDYSAMITAATNVLNIDIAMECNWQDFYASGYYEFDATQVANALGVSSLSEAMTFAQLPNGEAYYQGEDPAYWYGESGTIDGWGPDGRVFISYYGYDEEYPEDEYTLYVGVMEVWDGQYTCKVGDEYTLVYGLYANDKKVTFTFNITIVGDEQPAVASYSLRSRSASSKSMPYYMNLQKKAHNKR